MPLEDILRRVAGWAATAVAILGLAAVAGGGLLPVAWVSGVPRVLGACVALGGVSLWLQHRGHPSRGGFVCALTAAFLAAFALLDAALGLDFPTPAGHVWLFGAHGTPAATSVHGAAVVLTISIALAALRQQRSRELWPVSAWLASLVIAIGAAGFLATPASTAAAVESPIRISASLAALLVVLGLGTLLARPDDKHIRILFARNAAGILARRLFFAVAILPVLFAATFFWMVGHEEMGSAQAVVLFIAATILSGFIVALGSVETAAGMSEGREEAEQARLLLTARLQQQAAELQETVSQRTRELREANASLRATAESNALLALVAQNTTSGVVITDADGRAEWVNAAFTRLAGFELADIRGRRPDELLDGPETDARTMGRARDALRDGKPCHLEILVYTKTGRTVWVELDLQPVREAAGRLVNFVANLTDITTERADKIHLEHLSERLKLATRAAELAVWEWDAKTQHWIWDARALEIFGLSPHEFKGTTAEWVTHLHPDDRARTEAIFKSIIDGVNSAQHEFRIVRASDGAVRYVSSSAIAEREPQGRLIRIIGTYRDNTAQRESTQQLQMLNERLRLAVRSSNYGVWENDLVRKRRFWDDRVLEMHGLRPDQFDGSEAAWRRTFHPEDMDRVVESLQRVIASESLDYDLQYRIVRPDGAVRHIEAHGHVQRDASGRAVRLVGLSRDITESKQLEQALELAEQRWQLAIEGSNDSVWDWDVTTGHVYHDERWTKILGYGPGELDYTIQGWIALAHPGDLPANEAAIQEHFAQRTSYYSHELRMRAKDGTWRWILDRGKVVRRAADGRPLRMVGTHSDVTQRRELEDRLRKTEQIAQEVSRIAQIGGWEIDLVSSRVTWNEGTRRIHEVDADYQPTVEGMWSFFPPEAAAVLQNALRAATPAEPSFDVEVPMQTIRGRRIWVRMLGHGEFDHGRAVSVRGAIQDITGRHESEEARRQLEAQLFQAQKMETLGTLAGGIAHDFNNLLTGIIGYHELATDSLEPGHPARECLAEAHNASLRARELVEQILTFGRHSSSSEFVPLDLVAVVEEARRFLRATLPANIGIDLECAPHCGQVLGDATQIHQVILNLGSNGAHAMKEHGGTLRIKIEPAEVSPDLALTLGGPAASSYIRISVSDTGHGMDEATRRRIFDPFFTTKNTREGTGLGLAVVHGIVRSHHGAIDVESTPGKGSTFHVFLPMVVAESTTMAKNTDEAPRGEGEFVCVVDDEEVVGSCTKLVLESLGYRSLIFSSAEQCLNQIQANPAMCSVLVTDQTMPGMQGTELAGAVRKLRPELPVVIMSGYFSKIPPQALDELGQVELLAKPFTTDELSHAVNRALHPELRDL